jgi:hypothetical protein
MHLIKAIPIRTHLTIFHLPPRPYRAEHDLPLAEWVGRAWGLSARSCPREGLLRGQVAYPLYCRRG